MNTISGQAYWDSRSQSYINGIEGPYHANRLKMVEALLEGLNVGEADCLDFGCGDGVFAERLLREGARITGVDVDQVMVSAAQERLGARWPECKLVRGGVEAMEHMQEKSFDFLFALNVLAYLNAKEEETFYRQTQRLLRPGGALVVTHPNELFDMFTFNRYTVNFFKKHFSMPDTAFDVGTLLAHPDRPDRFVFSVRENPLAYCHKLKKYGFAETRQEFAILHSLPPLLTPTIDFDDINSRTYPETQNWPEEERWKLMFMCSVFGSLSIYDDSTAKNAAA